MKINHYVQASSIHEAYDELLQHKTNAILGGGAWLKLINKPIGTLIDLSKLSLDGITETKDMVEIGSMTTLRQMEQSPILKTLYGGILARAAKTIMGVNVRNLATIGGSIMGKYSFSDVITPLLVINPTLIFYKHEPMTMETYVTHKGRVNDILIGLQIKKSNAQGVFHNVKKTSLDFAIINVAITKGDALRIAVGARPGIATLATETMAYLNKCDTFNDQVVSEAVSIAAEELSVSSNVRASATYRRELLQTYIKRGLKEVLS